MSTAIESIQKFDQKTSELINSKFLLAEKKIEEVLVTIADSVLLYEIFEHVTEGFDYETFKSVCFSRLDGKGVFRLPKNDSDVIAFCFSLLLEIDGGKVDLLELCNDFFTTDEGKQKSFNLFAYQLLIPFKNATLSVAYAVLDSQGEKVKKPCQKMKQKSAPKTEDLPIKNYVKELIAQVNELSLASKAGDYYDELAFALEELDYYLSNKNLRGVTLAFTAIKYLASSFSEFNVDLAKLSKLISEVV